MASRLLGLYSSVSRSGNFKMLVDNWVTCMLFMLVTCLVRAFYKRITNKGGQYDRKASPKTSLCQESTRPFSLPSIFSKVRHRRTPTIEVTTGPPAVSIPLPPPVKAEMRYQNRSRRSRTKKPFVPVPISPVDTRPKQPYDAFLVLDIEGTCNLGTDFNYPNEIIVRDKPLT